MRRTVICILALSFLCTCAFAGSKKALAVFVGNYPKESGWSAIASLNDRQIVLDMLYANGFDSTDVTVLADSAATYDGIVSALQMLALRAGKGDEIYVHFSCHGQQITDQDGDEALINERDKLDEALVPYDAGISFNWNGYRGENHLIDDVLNFYFSKIQKAIGGKGSLLVVYDACHSGNLDKGAGGVTEYTHRGTYDSFKQPLMARKGEPVSIEVTWVSISACKDFQTNYEVSIEGTTYGRLSYAMSRCLKRGISTEELISALQAEYSSLPMPSGKCQTLQYFYPSDKKKMKFFKDGR